MNTLREEDSTLRDPRQIARKFKNFSMMGQRRFVKNLQLASAATLDMSQHSVVECGVWRGGASFGMMELFPSCPEFHLFDSFEGLPEPTRRDGLRAKELSQENLFVQERNYAECDDVKHSITRFGFTGRATVHKGWFDDTVFAKKIERPIGILRLDGDWYDSTKCVLDRLFDSVAADGLIIVDDYFDWPGCSQAVHDFMSQRELADTIRTYENLIAYIKKKPSDYLTRSASNKEKERRKIANLAKGHL